MKDFIPTAPATPLDRSHRTGFIPVDHPDVPAARRVEARNVVIRDGRFRCPGCNSVLQIEYGLIWCPTCRKVGEPAYWTGRGVRIQNRQRTN